LYNRVKGLNIFKRFDYILLLLVLSLTAVGFLVLRSATATMNTGSSIIKIQAIAIILGFIVCMVLSLIDYTYFKPYGYFIYAVAILLLIYVIFYGFGKDINGIGSNSWIKIGSLFTFQPAEAAKIAYVMVIPALLAKLKEEFEFKIFFIVTILSLAPIGLILSQPEMGMAVVFSFSLLVMIFIYGIKAKWFFIGVGSILASLPIIWFVFLQEFQKTRIYSIFTPTAAQADTYHIDIAKIAIGSGQLKGQGLYNGIQTQSGSGGLPIKDTDFIFSVIGEELGFIGATLVILLIFAVIARLIYIAYTTDDLYGKYMVVGITGMIMFHFIENVAMNLGILPISGIPLPFVSGGGTAMLVNFTLIGLALSVSLRKSR